MSTSTEQAPDQPSALPRRRPSGMVLACAAVIVMIIVGGSLFWLAQSRKNAPAVSHHRATATATSSLPPRTPTTLHPSRLAYFFDTFAANFHGWSLASNGGYYRIMVNNSLILADTNPNSTLVESFPTVTNLDNYVVSVDFTINQGDANDSVGLYLRGDGTLDHDYRIDINGNNTIDLAREYLDAKQIGQTDMLIPPALSAYLKPPGQANTLTVFMIGSEITVEMNDIVVMTATDPAYTNGQIALFVHHATTSRSGVTASFTRAEIDRLASPFMTPVPTPSPISTLIPTGSPQP
ncbi:MAG TPA: family 16 glycoside hydrolase [Ktedonobacteraceae bacterium]